VNSTLITSLALLAADADPSKDGGSPLLSLLTFLIPISVLFYFLMIRPQQKEQARRRDMLTGIKKNDRVITAGGIYGVVTDINSQSGRVTIKVDEANNTKLRMALSSISGLADEETLGDSSKK